MKQAPITPGTLYVVPTPIGNLEDITARAIRVLKQVDLIAAEDTRKAQILFETYGISTPTISLFEGNEQARAARILPQLQDGATVALISEAGMPGISDPGQRLIQQCVEANVAIDVLPGPSAVTTALVLSGLPSTPFLWVGFLPRKGSERRDAIALLKSTPATSILFESPHRTGATLAELAEALGPRQAVLTRELSKRYQQADRDQLSELAQRYAHEAPRGEVTLVIGPPQTKGADLTALDQSVTALLSAGLSTRTIADALAPWVGRNLAYKRARELEKAPRP
ncbi:MAG: 16S rRNA (cytidine(1402)-2'-O)-methyltransferase [Deltaproteobacteria bacterium]|nr:16S rRNA (cytidine(1402)-2'-O)-methyltransferase [Deltaproteobacteria bacterium]